MDYRSGREVRVEISADQFDALKAIDHGGTCEFEWKGREMMVRRNGELVQHTVDYKRELFRWF